MTSARTELGSMRLRDESNSPNHTQSNGLQRSSVPDDIASRLGGKFSADLDALLKKTNPTTPLEQPKLIRDPEPSKTDTMIRKFALIRIQIGNFDGAIEFIQRHAPEEIDWLRKQLQIVGKGYLLRQNQKSETPIIEIKQITHPALIDAEAGRIARAIGQFTAFRAWAYGHMIDDGDGRIQRNELENIWYETHICTSKRHARRLLNEGIGHGYWTFDKRTKRVYLSGQLKVAQQLTQSAISADMAHLIETNKPGKRRIKVDLSGNVGEASANLYSAWMSTKDQEREGITISREMLCALWNVSIPTLLKWEEYAHIRKQANYAQQNDTSIDNVPDHAYLTLNRDGTYASAWRLPNTYTVTDESAQHPRTGKSKKVRKAVQREIMFAEQRGDLGDAALPVSGKLYFTHKRGQTLMPMRSCSDYLRKVSRSNGDVFQRRYFHIGRRHNVTIFEPYDLQTNTQQTYVGQRTIRRESDIRFVDARDSYRVVLAMEA